MPKTAYIYKSYGRNSFNYRATTCYINFKKKSIAGFKVHEGMPLGLTVTLRREKMYAFRNIYKIVLPRIRDFRGLNPNNFDKFGNYNLEITEQLVFPQIDYDSVDQRRGMNITVVTTAKNSTGLFLLKELGVPLPKK
jgi:large subunit ribosomal protein L5